MADFNPNSRDLKDVLDAIGNGTQPLYCAEHFYTPSKVSKPAKNCADCYRVLYWTLYAKTPDDDKQEFVEGLNMAITHMLEHVKAGTWDYKPKLEIESMEKDNT